MLTVADAAAVRWPLRLLTALAAMLLCAGATGSQSGCCLAGPLDLGRVLDEKALAVSTPFTPGQLVFRPYDGTTYSDNDFRTGEHTGTHLDAPFHFNNDSWTVDQIPVERLVANGVFMNFTEETAGDSNFRLQPSHVLRWMQRHGGLPDNAALLISYGWAQRYHNKTLYTGTATNNFFEYRYPGVSCGVAELLASLPQLVGFGVDTPNIDAPNSSCAHALLAANNVYNLETVNLDQPCLPARGFTLLSMPIKLVAGTGAPARVVAVPGLGAASAPPPAPAYRIARRRRRR